MGVGCAGGEQIRLDDVFDEAKVATGTAVSEHDALFAMQEVFHPPRDHGRIRASGILAWPEDVEETQPDGLEPVDGGEARAIMFPGELGGRIEVKK